MSDLKYFRKEKGKLIFTGEELHLYIPEYYYERGLATSMGEYIRVFGLLNMRVITGDKKGPLEVLNIPTEISIYPKNTDTKEMNLVPGEDLVEKYTIAKFFKGDRVLDTEVTQDSAYVEKFLNLLTGGKLPRTIPYNKILDVWQHNLQINNVHLGISSTVMEVIIAEIYRDKNKPEDKFALKAGKNPNISQYAYLPASIRDIAAYNSTFQAIIFEDMDRMITSGLNNTIYDKKQTESPIEKIIKM